MSSHKLRKSVGLSQMRQAPIVTDIMARHPSQKAMKHILEQSEKMQQGARQKSPAHDRHPGASPASGKSSIPEYKLLHTAEERRSFRSKLQEFQKVTTEQCQVFSRGPNTDQIRVQHSIEIPASHWQLLMEADLGQGESSRRMDTCNVDSSQHSHAPSAANI